MPSGKHRSKENTWTEKDLNEALQGEKPRRSKDDRKRRETEDSSQKRSKDRTNDEQEQGRRHSKQERSSKIKDEHGVNDGAGSSSGTRSERKDRDRNGTRDKHSNGDNERRKRGKSEHSSKHEENGKERRKHKEGSGGNDSDDEDRKRKDEGRRQKREREDIIREGEREYHERKQDRKRESEDRRTRDGDDRRRSKDHDERRRDNGHDDKRDKERDKRENREHRVKQRDGEGRNRDEDHEDVRRSKDYVERKRDNGHDDRRDRERDKRKNRDGEGRSRDEVHEDRRRDRNDRRRDYDDRKENREHREREVESYDKGRDDRKRGDRERDDRRRSKDYDDRKERKEHRDRKRDEEEDDRGRNERKRDKRYESERDDRRREKERSDRKNDKEGGDDDDRERRRRKRGEKSREENSDVDSGQHSRDKEKDRRRKKREKEAGDRRDEEDEEEKRRERRRKRREKEEQQSKENGQLKSHKEISKSLSSHSAGEVVEDIANADNEDNYEDDFEDYEDDFEDGGEVDVEDDDQTSGDGHDKGKLLEIFEAINAENSDVARSSPYSNTPTEDSSKEESEPVRKAVRSSGEGRINFFAAKKKHVNQFVASKTKKRAEELKNLIELDVASYDIFDLPPLNEYELYIKSYGQSDSKQAYVQCHDDIVEKEMQTEEIEINCKWTQYPPDGFKGYGGDEDDDKDSIDATFSPHSVDSVKLSNFLQKSGQVCLILLEEMVCGKADLMFKERNDINISDGFIQLETRLSFLEGRRILDVCFNPIQTHILLTAHDVNQVSSDNCLHGKGVVCFWNVNEPTQPQKIMFCESSPGSCCFSPIKSSLVFAGLDDGSIVIWDIREASSLHSTKKDKNNQWIVRRPTFSTAGVFSEENHTSPIKTILPISLPKESAQASMRTSLAQDDLAAMAFQLASLEENGCVNIWVVIELDNFDEAGSENDLGMAPGGRIKLVKTTSIQVESPHRDIFIGSALQSSMMQFSTEDSNHFYVATDRGWVVHCTRYGGKTQPKTYKPIIDSFVTVSAMDISPWSIPILLVGCTDGCIRLHDLNKELPIRCWSETTKNNSIIQMMWSRSKPSMFYVLDNQSTLYIWDLLQNDSTPISKESFKRGRLLSFSLSNDYECLGIGLPGRKSELILNYEGGIIELHRLKEIATSFQADELDKFASLVDSFIS